MTSILPIGIGELLSGAVEGVRLELKRSFTPELMGIQVLRAIAAFANDLQNLNGGYVILGVAEQNGVAVRPVAGIPAGELDAAQKWIRGNCHRLEPAYMPVIDTPEIDGRQVLVLWAPASDFRPHLCPTTLKGSDKKYFVRIGSESVEAREEILTQLLQQTARVPFDDRKSLQATIQDLRYTLVQEFLHEVQSELLEEKDIGRVYRSMFLTRPQNGHEAPRNFALLFFTDDAGRWFRGARIEAVRFADDAGGDVLDEQAFTGPLHHQLRRCFQWLEAMIVTHLEKNSETPEARGWVSFPAAALREAVVNAAYHRGYEHDVEPIKIYLYPDRVEVISYPGPVHGVELVDLQSGRLSPTLPARNRRIGEILKELRLAEGRGTGLPKILRALRNNGSPDPKFDFDSGRSYFRVTLPAHPEYAARAAARQPPQNALDYLALDRRSPQRLEWLAGKVVRKNGQSRQRSLLTLAIASLLRERLRERGFETYASNMRVKVPALDLYAYPDVVVTGAVPEFEDQHHDTLLNPLLVVEIGALTSADQETRVKTRGYRLLPSLKTFVLLAQDRPAAEVYSRQGDQWLVADVEGLWSQVALPAFGFDLGLAEIYADILPLTPPS